MYERYLSISNDVAGGDEGKAEELKALLGPRAYENELKGIKYGKEHGIKAEGKVRLSVFKKQRIDPTEATVTAYACVDFTKVRAVDSDGKDITPEDRKDLKSYAPLFEWQKDQMILVKNAVWSGKSVC